MKPNYLVIGAAKAATSSLCALLGRLPDVFMVECKEPYFFNIDENYLGKGWEWYESLYKAAGDRPLRGEGSNGYTMKELFPRTVERIARDLPDAKLIYVAREPLSRIQSFWIQLRANGDRDISPCFDRAVRRSAATLVDSTNYLQQLEAYRKYFPDEQILVLFYEDFRADQKGVMDECCRFLGVDPNAQYDQDAAHVNPSSGKLVYRGVLTHLQSMPGFKTLMRPFPASWKTTVRTRLFRTQLTSRPTWNSETRTWVLGRIGDDCREFLRQYRKPASFWNLDAPQVADEHANVVQEACHA